MQLPPACLGPGIEVEAHEPEETAGAVPRQDRVAQGRIPEPAPVQVVAARPFGDPGAVVGRDRRKVTKLNPSLVRAGYAARKQ